MLAVDVEKRLGEFAIAARFETAAGVTALFGPSGSGKTTLVNMIAGLVTPDRGRITLADEVLFDSKQRINVPAHRRLEFGSGCRSRPRASASRPGCWTRT